MDTSLLALTAALGGTDPKPKKGKGKGKGKALKGKDKMSKKKKAASDSPVSAPPELMKVLAATIKTVDTHTTGMEKHTTDIAKMQKTMESIQQVVVQLGKRSLEASAAAGPAQKKKRKVPDHIVNYYLVATEFFSHFSPLTGVAQKKALGKAGVDAWGQNKDALVQWFKDNDLNLEANKLKIGDIRSIVEQNCLFAKFKSDFAELCSDIENAEAPEPEQQEDDDDESSDGSDDDEEDEDGKNDGDEEDSEDGEDDEDNE